MNFLISLPVSIQKYLLGCILFAILTGIIMIDPNNIYAHGSPPDYFPDGPHPRIYLTPSTLSALRAEKMAGSVRWVALESWCDAHLGDAGYDDPGGRVASWNGNNTFNGYRMSGFRTYLMNYAMAYQVLKETNPDKAASYATYAKAILIDGIAGAFNVGEEVNGLFAIRGGESGENERTNNAAEAAVLPRRDGPTEIAYKMGYAGRNLDSVAIAYDWLHDELLPSDRATLSAIMFRWYDWMRGVRSIYNNGVLISGTHYYEDADTSAPAPYNSCTGSNNCTTYSAIGRMAYAWGSTANNFYGGEFLLASLTGIATYGDDPYAGTLHSYTKNTLLPALIHAYSDPLQLEGGESMEGWSYGGGYAFRLQAFYGYYTGTQENIFSGISWPRDLLKANIHRLYPNMTNIPIWGDNGVSTGINLKDATQIFVGINKELNPTEETTKVGQWLMENSPFAGGTEQADDLLWDRPSVPAINPAASTLPLYNHAVGNGIVSMRSSWNNAPDTVLGLIILEGKREAAHENADDGQFYVIRGNDSLLDRETYTDTSLASNTIVFNTLDVMSNNPAITKPAIDRAENSTTYAYVSGDVTASFQRAYYPNRANLFRRSMLYLRPNFFVIYDVTQSNPDIGNLKDWYTQYSADPTVTGDTISVSKGASKAFVKTLYPAGGSYTETNYTASAQNRWRIKFTPVVTQEYDQFLHVIEATDKTQPAMTHTVRIESNSGNMRGVYISDPMKSDNNWVAMFTADKEGALVNADISYVVPAAVGYPPYGYAPKHIFVDLATNTDFTFITPKSKNVSPQVFSLKSGSYPTEGRVYTSSSQGVVIIEPTGKVQIINK